MSKTTLSRVVASVAVLVICAGLFFAGWPFGTHETAGQQPLPAASPLPTVAALSPAAPLPGSAESNADRLKSERLQAESQRLGLTNAALDEALQKAEAAKQRAEANTEAMAMLTGKLLDGSLKVPRNTSEAGSLVGRNLADTAKFKQKWGDAIPAAGTPEADEYTWEKEALVDGSAAFLKFMADEKNSALFNQPDSVAQFQTVSLAGALGLRDDQAQGGGTVLDGYYQQFFTRGLNSEAQPETGFDAWHQQRLALSEQAYAAVAALLTPEQAAAFHGLYPAPGVFMFHVTFGGLPWLSSTL